MTEPFLRIIIRKIFTLMVLTVALMVALSSSSTPKTNACQSCLSETSTAYVFCRDHPDEVYYGCNFSTACDGGTRSANAIYRDECCDMPVHDGGWTLYCL